MATQTLLSSKQRAYAVDINPTDDSRGEILIDKDAVISAIKNVLLGYVGCKSRIFNQQFGSLVYNIIGEPLDYATASSLQVAILQAVGRWEPRAAINVNTVKVTPDRENAAFRVELQFYVRATDKTEITTLTLRGT